MKYQSISLDSKGLYFVAQLVLGAALVAALVWAAIPIYYLFSDESLHAAGGFIEEAGSEEQGSERVEEWLAGALEDDEGYEPITRVFRYVPERGKFVSVDLVHREVTLYQNGAQVGVYPVERTVAADAPNAPRQGDYVVSARSESQSSHLSMMRFPHYVHFGTEYALHGIPRSLAGDEGEEVYRGGSIELSDADAAAVFAFAATNTPVHVRIDADSPFFAPHTTLVVTGSDVPATSAFAYAITDLARGQVVLEKNAGMRRPIASITKLFTASVASELIGMGGEVQAPNGGHYTLGDLFYPLLLRSDNAVAGRIAAHAGVQQFLRSMNSYAKALGMSSTSFADPSGLSQYNRSSVYDLATFARHLYRNERYLLDISKQDSVTITSSTGEDWSMTNQNTLAGDPHFRGGKLGFTDEAGQTALSVFNVPIDGESRTVAVIVLGSRDWKQDTRTLLRWLLTNVTVAEEVR